MNWRTIRGIYVAGLLGICSLFSSGARAGELAAIVEDLSPGIDAVRQFDFLPAGTVVEVAEGDWIRLGYLRSCTQETISGGRVLVGKEQSAVTGGTVERRAVECDGGNLQLSSEQSDSAGVPVLRERVGSIEVALTVHGVSPHFRIDSAPENLELERLD